MPEAIGTQIFCLECLEEHWKIATNKDHAGCETSEQGKRMIVHNLERPFSDAGSIYTGNQEQRPIDERRSSATDTVRLLRGT